MMWTVQPQHRWRIFSHIHTRMLGWRAGIVTAVEEGVKNVNTAEWSCRENRWMSACLDCGRLYFCAMSIEEPAGIRISSAVTVSSLVCCALRQVDRTAEGCVCVWAHVRGCGCVCVWWQMVEHLSQINSRIVHPIGSGREGVVKIVWLL